MNTYIHWHSLVPYKTMFLASIIPSGAELNFPSTPVPLLGFHGRVCQSVTLALENKQMAMVNQSVNNRTSQFFVIENTVPFTEFQVCCDYHAPFLIACGNFKMASNQLRFFGL